jgi:hypothetical protein
MIYYGPTALRSVSAAQGIPSDIDLFSEYYIVFKDIGKDLFSRKA